MTKTVKIVISVIVVSLLAGSGALAYLVNTSLNQPLKVEKEAVFTIEKGSSLSRVCQQLIAEEVISDCLGHKLWSKVSPRVAEFKAGTYKINSSFNLKTFFAQIVAGSEQQFPFTIIAGENIYQVLDKIGNSLNLVNDLAGLTFSEVAEQLKIDAKHPEGYLYPETYFYAAQTTASSLLQRAVQKQEKVLGVQWISRNKDIPIKSPYQALILASIIEKESSMTDERDLIAGVFYNRINTGMRLQTDPTVIYGVWEEYKGDITRKHLKTKTPYNTYRIDGLPPTPIANPSEKSIVAVMQPKPSDYFYFVASGEGGHVFNKTLAAHNRSLKQYLERVKN